MLPDLQKELDKMGKKYDFPPHVDWGRIGTCKLEANDETMVFCRCGCRPYCPCHQQLPDERDGLCGKGRHPFWAIPTDMYALWNREEGRFKPFSKRIVVKYALKRISVDGRADYDAWVREVEQYPAYMDMAEEMVNDFIKEGGATKSKETYELVNR